MITVVALMALVAQNPDSTGTLSSELSRSMSPDPNCGVAISTSNAVTGFIYVPGGSTWAAQLDTQVVITNSSTTTATYCFSMDRTPVGITRHGYFSADDRGYYAAGFGNCVKLTPGVWPWYIPRRRFIASTAAPTPGSKPYRCSATSLYNCSVTADCVSGTCSAANGYSQGVHLFVIHGVSGGESGVCVAR